MSGTIHSGKRVEMVFEFFPDVPKLRESTGPMQFAIGRPGGTEILFKATAVLAEMRPEAAFVNITT